MEPLTYPQCNTRGMLDVPYRKFHLPDITARRVVHTISVPVDCGATEPTYTHGCHKPSRVRVERTGYTDTQSISGLVIPNYYGVEP